MVHERILYGIDNRIVPLFSLARRVGRRTPIHQSTLDHETLFTSGSHLLLTDLQYKVQLPGSSDTVASRPLVLAAQAWQTVLRAQRAHYTPLSH